MQRIFQVVIEIFQNHIFNFFSKIMRNFKYQLLLL